MKVSFVIPTLNSAKTLGECLDAILAQDFPRADYEIVIADAGSSDATVEIAKAKGVDLVTDNPLKTGEAGKAAGIKVATGDLIALVDSDNILPDSTWLSRMVAPFADPEIFASEPIAYSARESDPALTRYFAALGMNDPICLFVGNYDRYSAISDRWTGLGEGEGEGEGEGARSVGIGDDGIGGGFLKLDFRGRVMPTIGANGFIFRRSILDRVTWEPYFFDIDVAAQAVEAGCGAIAKVRTSIIHLYCERFGDFVRKQRRRINDFLFFAKAKSRTYPWQAQKKTGILLFILCCVLGWPLLIQCHLLYHRYHPMFRRRANAMRDLSLPPAAMTRGVALLHLPVCYVTLWVYGLGVIKRIFVKPAMSDRSNWQK